MDLHGIGALVTGGAHRLGRAFTLALAEAGCNVAVNYGRSADAAEATAAEVRGLGVDASVHQADLGDPEAPARLVREVAEAVGPLQILVNSAAIFPEDSLESVTREEFDATLAVNFTAPVFLTQALAARLPDDRTGAIVNVTDWRIGRPYPDHFSYTIAKAALADFTRTAAAALAPRIRVNAVALGAILPPPGRDTDYLRELAQDIPLRRTGAPDDVAAAVLALLRNDFITGQVLAVNGGADLV
jgi:NAD(P)-dependent dehydrogenase (short-subunit alcohol dehydrogenase family)